MRIFYFDIDGTLIRCGGAGGAAMRTALAEVCGGSDEFRLRLAGRTDRAIVTDAVAELGARADLFPAVREAYLKLLPGELASRDGRVLSGVASLLDRLTAGGEAVFALVTGNLRGGAEAKLRHFGLADRFDWELSAFGDDEPDRNDVARAAVGRTRERFGDAAVDRAELFVIGDTPNDIRCGRAIGARTVAVATGDFDVETLRETGADHVLGDLTPASTAGVM